MVARLDQQDGVDAHFRDFQEVAMLPVYDPSAADNLSLNSDLPLKARELDINLSSSLEPSGRLSSAIFASSGFRRTGKPSHPITNTWKTDTVLGNAVGVFDDAIGVSIGTGNPESKAEIYLLDVRRLEPVGNPVGRCPTL